MTPTPLVARRRARRAGALVPAAVVALIGATTIWLVPAASAAGVGVTLAPATPVPMQPLTVTANGSGCPPSAPMRVQLLRNNVIEGDMVGHQPSLMEDVVTDASGDFSVAFDVPVAYPGRWIVLALDCGPVQTAFEVPDLPTFTMSITPRTATQGVPTTFTLSGTGCPGDQVWFSAGQLVTSDPLVGGYRPVGSDGSWSFTVTTAPRATFGGFSVSCVIPEPPRAIWIPYGDQARVGVTTTSTTSSTTSSVPPVTIAPRFAG